MQTTQKGPADKKLQTHDFLFSSSCYYVCQAVGKKLIKYWKKLSLFIFHKENVTETHRNHMFKLASIKLF